MELLSLFLLPATWGHTKDPVEIKLFLKPDLRLRVKGIPLANTSIEEKDGRYAITIGNSYLSGDGVVDISRDEFYWDVYDRQLGTVICSEGQCLTHAEDGLEMRPCLDPSDFRSASQLFQIESIPGIPKDSNVIYRRMDLVGKVEKLVDPLNNRIAELVDRMDSFGTDPEEQEKC
ncbi:similarity to HYPOTHETICAL PROTEIN YXIF_BACSU [Encephalitozoon cuniculi GB-M1]|uniref:Uncharacterized protein n=2 Tax=Encephalitozoon cuniculi TaxID=6035 RepID=Q8SUY9_ENCCU|nr:uncharacterized protein ECU07_1070 [Encephalitozoon cuniculi GB-M1]AGE95876.1 hypothetical protein ECU07_1070 [Encephalitozoon cuniculi]KMV65832.1 hypothetical protein M970_071040 [Encephalitozoon cuniculi EcunIII-L]UYI27270.1 hypothetical protein J0A71_05g11290 [Encephalitozoon cuniculi]CAD25640.1 similarity to HYPOTHETICAL PROTEIN YXIF_BACSU [Encephalitozoon cuniculi GB-M1]